MCLSSEVFPARWCPERPNCPASQPGDHCAPEPRKPVSSVTGVRVTSSKASPCSSMLFASSAGGPVAVLDSFEALLSVVEVKDSRHWLFFLWQSDGQLQRSSVAVTPPRSRPPLHTSGNSRAWKGESLPEKSDLSAHGHVLSSWHPRAFPSLHP